MKYILIDDATTTHCSVFTKEFDTAEEAIRAGENDWSYLTAKEQKTRDEFYVLESVNPDENADDHFDGTPIRIWK